MRTRPFVLALALTLLGSSAALAQDTFHYDLDGRFGWFGPHFDSTLTFRKRDDGRWSATRSWAYRDAGPAPRMTGTADVRVRRVRENGRTQTYVQIRATFKPTLGAADVLASLGGTESEATISELTGNYRVEGTRISGWVKVVGRDGTVKSVYESGRRTNDPIDYGDYKPVTANPGGDPNAPNGGATGADGSSVAGVGSVTQPDATLPEGEGATPIEGDSLEGTLDPSLKILSPQTGVYLAGQRVRLEVEGTSTSKVEVVSGEAKISGRFVAFRGEGPVRLQIKDGDRISRPVDVEVVKAEIVGIEVLETIAISDANPPHFKRELGAEAEAYAWEPAAILQDTQLQLRVTFKAKKDLTEPAKVQISATEADFELEEEVVLRSLAGGQSVELMSSAALTDAIKVNTLDLAWSLGEGKDVVSSTATPLRIYTVYGQPVDNPLPRYGPAMRQGYPLNTKLHFELVCSWANNATRNVGNGDASIGYQVDNQMRHHVHWKEYGGNVPKIPHYPEGAEPPKNYDLIPGWVNNGQRNVSSLYYPSQDATRDVEQYEHYRNNFGWWVLDNPEYAGGRCNQQASLICDLVGTIGLEAEVYYIERVSRGRISGRPVRRYYRSSRSAKSWNFHGQAKVKMEDGSFWLYDGSGSSPPRRINGKVEELMAVPGPYIKYWEAWRYEDGNREFAPLNDWPANWQGVPLMKDEPPLDTNAADGTYAYKVGRGKMDDTGSDAENHGKTLTFYAVNVGGRFVYKVGEGKPEAPTYTTAVHGGIADWLGN